MNSKKKKPLDQNSDEDLPNEDSSKSDLSYLDTQLEDTTLILRADEYTESQYLTSDTDSGVGEGSNIDMGADEGSNGDAGVGEGSNIDMGADEGSNGDAGVDEGSNTEAHKVDSKTKTIIGNIVNTKTSVGGGTKTETKTETDKVSKEIVGKGKKTSIIDKDVKADAGVVVGLDTGIKTNVGEDKTAIEPKGDTTHIHKAVYTQDMTIRLPQVTSQIDPLSARRETQVDVALAQSQNLKIAQEKITALEDEIESLRLDNNELTLSGRTLKKKNEELSSQLEEIQNSTQEKLDQSKRESEVTLNFIREKDKKITNLISEKNQLENHLRVNFRKIRVREKELENRLELVRMEHIAINNSKDDAVLSLKRKVDQLSSDLDDFRSRVQDLNNQLNEKRETLQRTVKALRLALVMLENEDKLRQSG